MSLARAIEQTIAARGLTRVQVARVLAESQDRSTVYRILSGHTTDPRLDTLSRLCQVLQITPTALLQQAELWPYQERQADVLDVQLRTSFGQLQALPPEQKRYAVQIVAAFIKAMQDE